jgi:alpha-mannosidase
MAHQALDIESFSYEAPWRYRTLLPISLPAMGYRTIEMAYVEGSKVPKGPTKPVRTRGQTEIANGTWTVKTRKGARGVTVLRKGKTILGPGLSAAVYDDPWSTWGGMQEEPGSVDISGVLERWTVTDCRVIETGPWRAALWVRLAGKRSQLDLTLRLTSGRDAVDVAARVLWCEPGARLKLQLPAGDRAEFEVPGGLVEREPIGEVPALRWVRVTGGGPGVGFVSDALYNFDCKDGSLRATICRSPRFSDPHGAPADATPWKGRIDLGEHRFGFVLAPPDADLSAEADLLEQPPVVQCVQPSPGDLARQGSLMDVQPACLRVLAVKPGPRSGEVVLRVQNTTGRSQRANVKLFGKTCSLGPVEPGEIAGWVLRRPKDRWTASPCDAAERRLSGRS